MAPGYRLCSIVTGLSALAFFVTGALLIEPVDIRGRRSLRREVIALWVQATAASAVCAACLSLTLTHLIPGGGAD